MSNLNMSKLTRSLAAAALAASLAGCGLPGGGNDTEPVSSPPPVTQPAEPSPTPAQPAEPTPTPSQPQVDQGNEDMILVLTVNGTKYRIECDDLYASGCSAEQQAVWNNRIKDDPQRFSNWLEYLSKNQLLTKTDSASLRIVLGAGLNAATAFWQTYNESLSTEENSQNGYKLFSPLYPDDSDELKRAYYNSAVLYFWGENKDGESI